MQEPPNPESANPKQVEIKSDPFSVFDVVNIKQTNEREILEPTGYDCTLLKFAAFVTGKFGEQNKIVKQRINHTEGGYPWYYHAKSCIVQSIVSGTFEPIYIGIDELKKTDPQKPLDISNKRHSITALENFKEITLPLEFRDLKKEVFSPTMKSFTYMNIGLKVTATTFFRSNFKGEKIIGAIILNCVKTPLSKLQRQVATYLLSQFISKHVADNGEKVLPEFVLCIDIFAKNFTSSPKKTEEGVVKNAIIAGCKEFEEKWKLFSK